MILAYKFGVDAVDRESFGDVITEHVIKQRKNAALETIANKVIADLTWTEEIHPATGCQIFSVEPVVVFKWTQWTQFMNKLRISETLVNKEAVNLVRELIRMLENSEF